MQNLQPDYDLLHESHRIVGDSRTKSRDLFAGRSTIKAAAGTYLQKGVDEGKNWFDWRLKRAVYTNWIKAVVGARDGMLWRKAPSRNLPGFLDALLGNVDRRGNSANRFFRARSIDAEVDGAAFVLVNRPPVAVDVNGRAVMSVAEEREGGIRPYFEAIAAVDVFDWSVDDTGSLEWVVIRRDRVEPRAPGHKPSIVQVREVWWRDVIRTFERRTKGEPWIEARATLNGLGEIPLVPVHGVRDERWWGGGWPVCEDILDHALDLYNNGSDAAVGRYLSCNPLLVTITPQDHAPEKIRVSHGSTLGLTSVPGTTSDAKWLEITGMGAKTSADHDERTIRMVYEIAQNQARRDTAQVQSAEGSREDKTLFRSSLSTCSQDREDSERQCWAFAAKWEGEELDPDADGLVDYNRDFDDKSIAAAILQALQGMVDAQVLSRRSVFGVMQRGELIPDDRTWEEERADIEAEADMTAMPGFQTAGTVPFSNPAVPPGVEDEENVPAGAPGQR